MKQMRLFCLILALILLAVGCKKSESELPEEVTNGREERRDRLQPGVKTDVQVEGEGSSAVVAETESDNVQERGEEILKKMAEVNQYWLFGPTSDVKNYSYEFLLVDNAPRTIEVRKPANTGSSFRQGISYYTVLHKLASEPASAVITAIQEDEKAIRLDFTLKDSMKIACGNGISGT